MSWLQENIRQIYSLQGQQLETASIIEMAILESGANGLPQYTHPKCPFIQAQVIEWILSDGVVGRFYTYQTDYRWGIQLNFFPASTSRLTCDRDPQSIFRMTDVELPTGRINQIDLKLDSQNNVSRIYFTIGDAELLFVAGEVYEEENGISILLEDESILIFPDPSQIANVCFGRGKFI